MFKFSVVQNQWFFDIMEVSEGQTPTSSKYDSLHSLWICGCASSCNVSQGNPSRAWIVEKSHLKHIWFVFPLFDVGRVRKLDFGHQGRKVEDVFVLNIVVKKIVNGV